MRPDQATWPPVDFPIIGLVDHIGERWLLFIDLSSTRDGSTSRQQVVSLVQLAYVPRTQDGFIIVQTAYNRHVGSRKHPGETRTIAAARDGVRRLVGFSLIGASDEFERAIKPSTDQFIERIAASFPEWETTEWTIDGANRQFSVWR